MSESAQGHERILAVGNETFNAEGGRAGTSSAASTMRVVPHGEQVSFAAFCERHNIKLVAHERSRRSGLPPWYVSPQGLVEIRESGCLTSVHGNGQTPEEALADYARRLASHRLLIGGAHEVVAPNVWTEDD